MSLGTTLDVVIGLAFTYLLLGIIASGFQEAIVALINKRGKELQDGIAQLLSYTGPVALDTQVLSHGLIANLSQKQKSLLAQSSAPSYVPARNFALAVLDVLRADRTAPVFSAIEKTVSDLPPSHAKQSLTTFITDAAGDVATLQKSIETWFDDAMDRVSGVYKRFSQIFTLVFGLLAAIVFNVDSINLAHTLWFNDDARKQFVAAATQYVDQQKKATAASQTTPAAEDAKKTQQAIENAAAQLNKLPIGWADPKPGSARQPWQIFWDDFFVKGFWTTFWLLLGWLITGLATSLGAPFWFDVMSNLVQLRNAGPKPNGLSKPAATT